MRGSPLLSRLLLVMFGLLAGAWPLSAKPMYCMGNDEPSKLCRNCHYCRYCGGKENSGTCAVCQARKDAEAALRQKMRLAAKSVDKRL